MPDTHVELLLMDVADVLAVVDVSLVHHVIAGAPPIAAPHLSTVAAGVGITLRAYDPLSEVIDFL